MLFRKSNTTIRKSFVLTTAALLFQSLFGCGGDENTFKPLNVEEIEDSFFQDREVEVVFKNKSDGINVIFLGDGYVKLDLGKNYGDYRIDAMKHLDYLFSKAPFAQYKDFFNAYIVYAESEQEGIADVDELPNNTALAIQHTTFKFGEVQFSNPSASDWELLYSYAREAVPDINEDDIILVSVNLSGGGTGGGGIAVFGSSSPPVMLHEVGHAFGGLADEYFFENYLEPFPTQFAPNLDSTSNLELVKWSHFSELERYQHVRAYEGGGYTPVNVWRPQLESVMKNVSYEDFNAPSREAIVKRIYELNNLNYTFDAFLENDELPSITGRSQTSVLSPFPLGHCQLHYQNTP